MDIDNVTLPTTFLIPFCSLKIRILAAPILIMIRLKSRFWSSLCAVGFVLTPNYKEKDHMRVLIMIGICVGFWAVASDWYCWLVIIKQYFSGHFT